MWTLAVAAITLIAAASEVNASAGDTASYPSTKISVLSLAHGDFSDRPFDQRGLISPPVAIDPGMALVPPDDRGRLRIIQPPGTLDDGLHLK